MATKLKEALALYASEAQDGGDSEYRSISQFQEKIQAVAAKQKITGLHGLTTKELVHPFTDKPMVLKVMAWSPSSLQSFRKLQDKCPLTNQNTCAAAYSLIPPMVHSIHKAHSHS